MKLNKLVGCDGYMRIGGAYIMGKLGKYIYEFNRCCRLKAVVFAIK
jgi:hypothetical protein